MDRIGRSVAVLGLLGSGLAGLAGCVAPTPEPEPEPVMGEGLPSLTVDGIPVDCTRTTTIEVGASARVTAGMPENVEFDVALDEVDVRDRFGSISPHRALLELPEGRAGQLTFRRVGGAEPWQCDVNLIHRPAAEQGVEALRAVSAAAVVLSRSLETGAVNGGAVDVPTSGDTPSERAEGFLEETAETLGVAASTLREIDRWESPDGWTTLLYEQVFEGDVLAYGARLELQLDPAGNVRTFHSRLFADLEVAPSFVLEAPDALAIAGPVVGEIDGFRRVVHDPTAPKAGWYVVGDMGGALIDDATGEVLTFVPVYLDAPIEIHRPEPEPLVDTRRGVPAMRLIASGDTSGAAPAGLDAAERELFSVTSQIAREVQSRTGNVGWINNRLRVVTQAHVAEGTITLPDGTTARTAGAFYMPGRGTMFADGDARRRRETICHEYGHAFDDFYGGTGAPTFAEALGDVFYLFCEQWVNAGGRAYDYNDAGGRRHDRPSGRADQHDYDAFRALRIREAAIGSGAMAGTTRIGTHDHAFLITIALHEMMETHDLDREKATSLGFSAAAGNYGTYPDFRDRMLLDAISWARDGRYGFTEEDACAVAQGFRATKLDGEYGSGADCERSDRAELICTQHHCPVCGDREPASVCRPETIADGQPVCMTADGRRTCVGSLATSAEGCAEGQSHLCWCGSGGRWDCSGARECRATPENASTYCPEDRGPATSGAGMGIPTCAARPASAPSLGWLPFALLALVWARRRVWR